MRYTSISIATGVFLVLALSLSGCVDWCKDVVLKNYITMYSVSREIMVGSYTSSQTGLYYIEFSYSGSEFVDYRSTGEKLNKFTELAHKNGDTTYKEVIDCGNLGGRVPLRCFSSVPITDINITCDKDIDAQHPANSSIDDLFLLLSYSPDKFIKSGYKPLGTDNTKSNKLDTRFIPVDNNLVGSLEMVYGKLSDIDFSSYHFLGFPGYGHRPLIAEFCWITPPQNLASYTLTVEVTYADGLRQKASLTVNE